MKTPQELFPTLYNEDLMDEGINFSYHDMCNFAQDFHNEVIADQEADIIRGFVDYLNERNKAVYISNSEIGRYLTKNNKP